MKKPVCLLLLCFLFLQHAQAQNNTAGTDFWVTYQNTRLKISDTLNDISISISSLYNTSGEIYFTQSKDTIPFQVNAFGTFRYTIQGLQRQYCTNKYQQLGKDNLSVHITSEMPVIVSTHTYRLASNDATQIYPTPTWGNTYYVINPVQQHDSMEWIPCTMIVADQDSTVIYADQTIIDTLHRGDTYHGFFPTGTKISGNKPIGVFSADALMQLAGSGDCLLTQLPPVRSIGTSYFIPVTSFKREYIQVLATQNNTNVVARRGKIVTTPPHQDFNMGVTRTNNLKKGEWFWMEIYRDSLDSACYLQADKPIIVTSQMTSEYHNMSTPMSDPSKTWIASVAQRTDSILISPFTIVHYRPTINPPPYNMAMIVCSTDAKNSTYFNINGQKDTALHGGKWIDHPSGFSYYDMSLSTDSNTYLFVNNAGGLIVYLYGIGRTQSYYMQSAKLTNLLSAFYGNGIFYADLPDHFFCEQEITFTSDISGDTGTLPGHIKWYIDSVEVLTARDQNSWSHYFSKGTYTIEMEVIDTNRNSQRIASILHVVDLQAELHSTSEHCRLADGTIICSTNSALPQNVQYTINNNTYFQDTIQGLTAGWYHVFISDSVCLLEQDIFIDSIGGPLAEFEAIPATATVNYAVYFHDQSTDPYAPICSWHWNMGDSHTDSIQNPNHIFTAEGAYNVTLLVTDTNGCTDSISHVINIVSPFVFPNVFTPVGTDGSLYYFRPVEDKVLFDAFEISVYNRWGTTVWQQSCNDGQCPHYEDDLFWWDGCDSNGKRVSDGVYYWVAKAYSKDMPPIIQQGSVTIFSKP